MWSSGASSTLLMNKNYYHPRCFISFLLFWVIVVQCCFGQQQNDDENESFSTSNKVPLIIDSPTAPVFSPVLPPNGIQVYTPAPTFRKKEGVDRVFDWGNKIYGAQQIYLRRTQSYTIQFSWDDSSSYNVYKHPSGSCDPTNSIFLGNESGVTYTFTEEDICSTVVFASQIPGTCELGGRIVTFYVEEQTDFVDDVKPNKKFSGCDLRPPPPPETEHIEIIDFRTSYFFTVDWVNASYQDESIMAFVGDEILFSWDTDYIDNDIYIHPSGTCEDTTDSIELEQIVMPSNTQVYFTIDEEYAGNDIYFVSQIPGRCDTGQILKVSVAPLPTSAPTFISTYERPDLSTIMSNGSDNSDDNGGGDNIFCFSGNTIVDILGKGPTPMFNLRIGDRVRTMNNYYDIVYSFGHYNPNQIGEFLQITTNNKSTVIEMSKNHLILVTNGHYVPASTLKIGDQLVTPDNAIAFITKIKTIRRKGVYAPFTMSGTITVGFDNILASSFVTLQENQDMVNIFGIKIGISAHTMAYLFESFHRIAYHHFGRITNESYSSTGISNWVKKPHNFFMALLSSPSIVYQIIILLPCIGILALVHLVEKVFFYSNGALFLFLSLFFAITTAVARCKKGNNF